MAMRPLPHEDWGVFFGKIPNSTEAGLFEGVPLANPMRLGILVNPDAGLGGKLGFKGSDGRAEEARAAGAEDRAGPRMNQCLNHLASMATSSLNRTDVVLELVVWDGRMGGTW